MSDEIVSLTEYILERINLKGDLYDLIVECCNDDTFQEKFYALLLSLLDYTGNPEDYDDYSEYGIFTIKNNDLFVELPAGVTNIFSIDDDDLLVDTDDDENHYSINDDGDMIYTKE